MTAKDKYQLWLNNLNDEQKKELLMIDDEQINEIFAEDIMFGTAGLRGILGMGPSQMNIFTISKVTRGLGHYLQKKHPNKVGKLKVVVATDPRQMHQEFSDIIVRVLGTMGIKVIIFSDIKPTPMLSFAVRNMKCDAGIMITASHNPKEYNGYKVYNETGAQLNLIESELMTREVEQINDIFMMDFFPKEKIIEQGLLEILDDQYNQVYLDAISGVVGQPQAVKDVKIIFTPEHGCSYQVIPEAFAKFGFKNIVPVKEQMFPDGNFSATKSANPEELIAYEQALVYAKKNEADLIIANDPDGDRLGIGFLSSTGEYRFYTGNQTGVLLIDYLIQRDHLSEGIIYKTIVTGELGAVIAQNHGLKVEETLTGFKFIGEKIENNKKDKFIFGYEESYGYLIDPMVRDKDGVQSSLLIAEMTDFYLKRDLKLDQVMKSLYDQYGYFHEVTNSITLSGIAGLNKIKQTMTWFRKNDLLQIAGISVSHKLDYLDQIVDLPQADVIKIFLSDNQGWIALRPSGTEPKLKVYLSTTASSLELAQSLADKIYAEILDIMDTINE